MSVSTLTLTGFAALMEPVTDFVTSISWLDGEPADVLLSEKVLRHFGDRWYYDHPVWKLFDELDSWGVSYGFTSEEYR